MPFDLTCCCDRTFIAVAVQQQCALLSIIMHGPLPLKKPLTTEKRWTLEEQRRWRETKKETDEASGQQT